MKIRALFIVVVAAVAFSCSTDSEEDPGVSIVPGFKVEKILSTDDQTYGSWVSLNHVEGSRFVASDQYGDVYWVDIPSAGSSGEVVVTPLEVSIGRAQGLLWADGYLFVMVNDSRDGTNGLFRIEDSNDDGQLDNVKLLKELNGWGEHGPHGVIKGPDGFFYVIAGNHTDVPEEYTAIAGKDWAEDRLFTAMLDPNGHARERGAPGGWIARTDADGSFWEIYANGFRNAYDIAFNEDGELFTFDSDMEWDLALPWYRPIRVCHVTSGAEFGWRTGSGKWPSYYQDNLPGIVDIGQGSPTGVIAGMTGGFKGKYGTGLFICDWSFGTMYHVDLDPKGSSYEGSFTEFLSGVPLPLTDVCFGSDGAMYFTTGGRRLQSGLYRVTATENAELVASTSEEAPPLLKTRKEVEKLHDPGVATQVQLVRDALHSDDRTMRYAAQVAVEVQGPEQWSQQLQEFEHRGLFEYAIPVAHKGDNQLKQRVLDRLMDINVGELPADEKLSLIRAQSLLLIKGAETTDAKVKRQWMNSFPSSDSYVNEELSYLFAYMNIAEAVPVILELAQNQENSSRILTLADSVAARSDQYGKDVLRMKQYRPSAHKIALMDALSHFAVGWNQELMKEYYTMFNSMWDRHGGYSYRGFLLNIMDNSMSDLSDDQREFYRQMAGADLGRYGTSGLAELPTPEGPGQAWNVDEVVELVGNSGLTPDYNNGAKMFDAALCRSCHQIQGQGSNFGPDLTTLGNRFSDLDMATAIIHPDSSVTDQYLVSQIEMINGRTYSGKIVRETDSSIFVMENPLVQDNLRELKIKDIKATGYSSRSLMFPGMLNRLNRKEVLDLMAFLKAGGNSQHEIYND